MLHPFTILEPKKVKLGWTEVEQESFEKIKQIVEHETLFSDLGYIRQFDMHNDVRDFQLEPFISQNEILNKLYSRKPMVPHTRYMSM